MKNSKTLAIIPEIKIDTAYDDDEQYPLPESALTQSEIHRREKLEAQVTQGQQLMWQGFYQVGSALRQIKILKLHRDTHQRFHEYVAQRFKIAKRQQYYLIGAAEVIDALKDDSEYFEEIKGRLPEREYQCRELLKIGNEPDNWKKVWQESLNKASGEVPTAKTVREVVRELKSSITEQNPFQVGDICLIEPKDNVELNELHNCWGIVVQANQSHCDIKTCLGLRKNILSQYLLPSAYTPIQQEQIKKICSYLDAIGNHIREEEATIALMKIFGKRFVLSDLEAELLTTLLKQQEIFKFNKE